MKRICIIFCSLVPLLSYEQNCKKPFLGSKTLYYSQQQNYTQTPKGYTPVFINHVGRHGARHLTKDVNSSYIYKLLLLADSLNNLSADGKLLKEKILRLEKLEKKNFKSISYQGKNEQIGLADRMYSNYTSVFNETRPFLKVAYTKEIRTLQTSDAFLGELKTKINEPSITRQINDTTLRFYDLSPAYRDFKENGNWKNKLQELKKALSYQELAKEITQHFFTPSFFNTITEEDRDKFTSDLYGFISIFYSIKKEVADAGYKNDEVDMKPFLTCPQLYILSEIDNAEDFFTKGPGTDINGIQVKIAVPLLVDFIKTTDEYIKTKTVNAQLRFSHAETIAPFAALLGLTSAAGPSKKITVIDKIWRADKTIPLSSNIQWVLYKKVGSEKYLVKFLLNEKETGVNGLKTKIFPYYNWDDVRVFYINKIQDLNSGLDADALEYLKKVK